MQTHGMKVLEREAYTEMMNFNLFFRLASNSSTPVFSDGVNHRKNASTPPPRPNDLLGVLHVPLHCVNITERQQEVKLRLPVTHLSPNSKNHAGLPGQIEAEGEQELAAVLSPTASLETLEKHFVDGLSASTTGANRCNVMLFRLSGSGGSFLPTSDAILQAALAAPASPSIASTTLQRSVNPCEPQDNDKRTQRNQCPNGPQAQQDATKAETLPGNEAPYSSNSNLEPLGNARAVGGCRHDAPISHEQCSNSAATPTESSGKDVGKQLVSPSRRQQTAADIARSTASVASNHLPTEQQRQRHQRRQQELSVAAVLAASAIAAAARGERDRSSRSSTSKKPQQSQRLVSGLGLRSTQRPSSVCGVVASNRTFIEQQNSGNLSLHSHSVSCSRTRVLQERWAPAAGKTTAERTTEFSGEPELSPDDSVSVRGDDTHRLAATLANSGAKSAHSVASCMPIEGLVPLDSSVRLPSLSDDPKAVKWLSVQAARQQDHLTKRLVLLVWAQAAQVKRHRRVTQALRLARVSESVSQKAAQQYQLLLLGWLSLRAHSQQRLCQNQHEKQCQSTVREERSQEAMGYRDRESEHQVQELIQLVEGLQKQVQARDDWCKHLERRSSEEQHKHTQELGALRQQIIELQEELKQKSCKDISPPAQHGDDKERQRVQHELDRISKERRQLQLLAAEHAKAKACAEEEQMRLQNELAANQERTRDLEHQLLLVDQQLVGILNQATAHGETPTGLTQLGPSPPLGTWALKKLQGMRETLRGIDGKEPLSRTAQTRRQPPLEAATFAPLQKLSQDSGHAEDAICQIPSLTEQQHGFRTLCQQRPTTPQYHHPTHVVQEAQASPPMSQLPESDLKHPQQQQAGPWADERRESSPSGYQSKEQQPGERQHADVQPEVGNGGDLKTAGEGRQQRLCMPQGAHILPRSQELKEHLNRQRTHRQQLLQHGCAELCTVFLPVAFEARD
ncbi:hypothetical protein, conserved [Eimeria praecox]|uniref:Uncharacterized protein n=1 Tax=Eimeria praecox TaxID=51316 RepID=U6GP42_9EIME|nr:hypothetical protein, conserved [Eimeria praecox]